MNEPNATLYVSNIDWKIKKPILRRALHTLFSRHGKILEIITLRNEGLRGQAWIIFASVTTATAALQAEQNFTFFGKNLKINYANEKSDRVAKRDGTYVPQKDRRKKKRQLEAVDSGGDDGISSDGIHAKKLKLAGVGSGAGDIGGVEGVHVQDPSTLITDNNNNNGNGDKSSGNNNDNTPAPPSNILFAEALPKDCNEMMLACLFRSYQGYKEVRIPRSGLAFIEFDDEPHASVALKALNGFKLSNTEALNLKYGKA